MARLAIRSWLPPSQTQQILIIEFVILTGLVVLVMLRTGSQKSRRGIIVLLFVWLISLLPYITLGIDTKGVESERFLYMPSLFVCVLIIIIIFQLPGFVRAITIMLICTVNVLSLAHHAKQYRFAGAVVESTISGVNRLQNKTHLIAEGVPQENFGALIFRSGFPEGIDWLKNNSTVDSIVLLSQSHTDLPLQKNYPFEHSHDLLLIPDTSLRNHFSTNDAYLLYTDSTLKIITRE